jgi:hypothetical protein
MRTMLVSEFKAKCMATLTNPEVRTVDAAADLYQVALSSTGRAVLSHPQHLAQNRRRVLSPAPVG